MVLAVPKEKTCPLCTRTFNARGYYNHYKSCERKRREGIDVRNLPPPVRKKKTLFVPNESVNTLDQPQPQPAMEPAPEINAQSNFQSFSSFLDGVGSQTTDKEPARIISDSKDIPYLEGQAPKEPAKVRLTLTVEQCVGIFKSINGFLDEIIVLAGGDKTFTLIGDDSMQVLGGSLKSVIDVYDLHVTPLIALAVTISATYSIPTTRALKSIRDNRNAKKRAKEQAEQVVNQPSTPTDHLQAGTV